MALGCEGTEGPLGIIAEVIPVTVQVPGHSERRKVIEFKDRKVQE